MAAEVFPLHRRACSATRPSPGVAELRAELAAVRDRLTHLLGQLEHAQDSEASTPQRAADFGGPVVSLAEAAHAVGWSEQRTRRHIVTHNARYPHDRLGWQAGGLENGRWSIPLARWRRYVEHIPAGEP
ncbi:hypothetical protein [Methylobacterium brachiatum]|uniref:hypothetical protein n=1 Tax=Methylobacterium brachiatum TaxID=269660 RepID=UPI0008EC232E|nr:hypothetical protein [Methylobacterium brachiatum]SFI85135.1 hypothetical protein SAMN02799642_02909 [Methylobacterium brachiatum]